ncbi:hypothetical protein MLP_27970 [Microlunatus phosphovorus NM-1]|uniref:Nudix hydrolase domain-containing protein n=2 Tax=Microlunatus phosphovorus TaxID=29405 RepID=F5XIE2_MICPN|nr:hypothetical protein MLP_27970 [Microlunatus phosphovorus NM-1]
MSRARDRAANVVLGPEQTLLVIRRVKESRRYCVLPGGGVEPNEQPADSALRELQEETGLVGQIDRKLWTVEHPDRVAHYYLTTVNTSAGMRLGGPERERIFVGQHLRAHVDSAGRSRSDEPAAGRDPAIVDRSRPPWMMIGL